ncbi:DUF5590 domain-containing protein [Bacillus sp. CRN 9]|uniref:cell wall elongation regulator TseB-like domain-containing protein n=1 Tax=Cytobacillus horneckiae TaxID=549687 RepID=UPI001562E863|nr:DUF5590 domain-containing protein [Bacillus sp. CRN 9]
MKKIIIISMIVVVVMIGLSGKVYMNAVEPVKDVKAEAVKRAEKEVNLTDTNRFSLYNGNETIYVIDGKLKNGDDVYAWVPEGKGDITVKKKTDGISKEEAVQSLLNEKKPTEIIAVRLGMEKNIPLWEISYRTKGNLLNYYMIDFETGKERLKIIENL